ncbi:DEAD-domain-containing protein [Corynespora cassiicola Philippines]|uniref:RNA helicase n=1 Tax=Corynespora cassiicola Philippines TaxID=1448308 RepID=A0A2T2P512_CORCC|nr:DEAD-domain-containing protein [Corynespora cassiicola Philippines]
MASRHADSARSRGGDRYSAPRRDDRREDRRDDRRYDSYSRDDRRRDDRRDDRRGDRRDRYDDRRDVGRRDRDARRSRSPAGRRDRSRDRYSDRYRDDRSHRDRGYDDRERDHRRRDDRYHGDRRRDERGGSYESDRRLGSASATPGADSRLRSDGVDDVSRDERHKRDETTKEQEKEDEKKKRLAKLELWKKQQAEKKALDLANTPGAGASPAMSGPSTPTVVATPPATTQKEQPIKAKTKKEKGDAAMKQTEKRKNFQLDPNAAIKKVGAAPAKANGVGASSGKSKPNALQEDDAPTKNILHDDEDNTTKRTLQALEDFEPMDVTDVPALDDDDVAMSDIDSDSEELRAQLQKRAEGFTNENNTAKDLPTAGSTAEKMEVDEGAGAADDDDIDPLDAFMAGLHETEPKKKAPQGQAMFSDDAEPDMTAVEGEDFLALAASKKKKSKEVPVVDHSKVEYEDFRKNFYTQPSEISQMTPEEVADLRHELEGIKVKPDDVPRPVTKWAQMGLLQQTIDVFSKVGYERPTSIQAQAIPIAESGMDLIGVAKTGSGKTLAFGIPMIRHILDQRPLKPTDGPIVLILAPTRELSQQIVTELKPFLKASRINIACAYGGPPISEQIAMIKRGNIHVLCATPGRLIDLMQSNNGRVLSFKRITYVVLDEADRMFDMGFEPQVRKVLDNIRPDRQTILFSATFPKNMAALARKALTNPAEVIIGGRSVVASEITQIITVVPPTFEKKLDQLLLQIGRLFNENENNQVLVFVERQETAEDLLSRLIKAQWTDVNTIHGAKDQEDRTEAIEDFKKGILRILIATSVAARGLDVPRLAMVFNFDCPTHLEDYVHRCGRTGRAGNKGTAITLIENPGQERYAVHLAKALKQSDNDVPEDLQKMVNVFTDKVKAGQEKWYDPGFGGKGLDKLDATRAAEKRREKRAHKLEGEEASDDEAEMPLTKKTEATPPPGSAPAETTDEPSWMSVLKKDFTVHKTERPEASSSKPMTAKERALAAANKVDGRLSMKGKIHHGQPIDNKGPDAGLYHSTIEINDFPQKARWAVTNRTNVAKILENTGVSITTKGNFYAKGKEPGGACPFSSFNYLPSTPLPFPNTTNDTIESDLPKLYILVEGDTENQVTSAMMELVRLLKEGTMADDGPARLPGRYNVV